MAEGEKFLKQITEINTMTEDSKFVIVNYDGKDRLITKENFLAGCSNLLIKDWQIRTEYKIYDVVIYDGTLYQCKENHISELEFNDIELKYWKSLTGIRGPKGDKGEQGPAGIVEINADCVILYANFLVENWIEENIYFTQTVEVDNITENNMPIVDLKLSDNYELWEEEEIAYSNLIKLETGNQRVTAYCLSKPEKNFTIKLRISGDIIK